MKTPADIARSGQAKAAFDMILKGQSEKTEAPADLVRSGQSKEAFDLILQGQHKEAATWGIETKKFVDDFDKAVREAQKGMVKDLLALTTRLFDQLQKGLGEYKFREGYSAEKVAKDFLSEVFAEYTSPYNEWAVSNFFRQGYAQLERPTPDFEGAIGKIEKAVEDFSRKQKWQIERMDLKRGVYEGSISGKVSWRQAFDPAESFVWVDNLSDAVKKALGKVDRVTVYPSEENAVTIEVFL